MEREIFVVAGEQNRLILSFLGLPEFRGQKRHKSPS